MGTIEKIIYVRSLIHKDSAGGKYILQPDLDKVELSETEKKIIQSIFEEDKVSINTPITEEDRSKLVKDFEYGEISESKMYPIDVPKKSEIDYDEKGDVKYADFSELDRYINEEFIPENIHIKVRLADKYGPEYYSIQLNRIVRLKLSEIEFEHVMKLLKRQNIIVCGTSEYPDDQFENYDYFYRLKNIQTPDCIDREETLDLFEKMFNAENQNERTKIRNQIVVGNMRLAKWVLFKMSSYYDLDKEWETYAYEGLIQAVERFSLDKGCYFSSFAVPCIRNFIKKKLCEYYRVDTNSFGDFIRAKKIVENKFNRKYIPGDKELLEEILALLVATNSITEEAERRYMKKMNEPVISLSDDEVEEYATDENVESVLYMDSLKADMNEVLATLTDRESKLIKLRFGLEDGKTRTLEELGKYFDISRESVRHIEDKALRKLRHPSRARKIMEYREEPLGYETRYIPKENIFDNYSDESTKIR